MQLLRGIYGDYFLNIFKITHDKDWKQVSIQFINLDKNVPYNVGDIMKLLTNSINRVNNGMSFIKTAKPFYNRFVNIELPKLDNNMTSFNMETICKIFICYSLDRFMELSPTIYEKTDCDL